MYIYSFAIFAVLPLYYSYITAFLLLISSFQMYIHTGLSLLRGWGSPPYQPKICSPPSPKFLFPPHQKSIQPNKKTSFLAVVIAPVPFLC